MGLFNGKKEFNYFDCFCRVTDIIRKEASYLVEAVESFDVNKIDTYAADMHKLENDADAEKHILSERLAHEFMPPIEREDISTLSQQLDNIADLVEDVMRKIYMYNIKDLRPEALGFAKLVAEACETFHNLMLEFHDFKKSKTLREYIIKINTIENQGDKLHAESIRNLFTEGNSASAQLAWTMIFESFENSIDACETAADTIDSVITKNT